MAGAFTERSLWLAINCTIPDPGELVRKQWFEGPLAPFSTFAAKITLGRALNIYGSEMEGRLNTIKRIRNQFAHAPRPIDFSHPSIEEACEPFFVGEIEKYRPISGRSAYLAACMALAEMLQDYSFQQRNERPEPFYP
ncbi:hypothetical protein [Sphingobium sp. B12D2B]|uniref:hypothetical protein n=1 Tax=Sphingobium sp. B12D2B TaxID=2940577 RepID=UPI002223F28A|nr:hypothetical protein [Sphingobium sp. B12D2B]MCW2350984.1 hypothetical protein [Sphingobium sp. B12D2B]